MRNPGKAATTKQQKRGAIGGLKSHQEECILGQKTRLRQKRMSDARNDHKWRSDPELSRLDAAPVLKLPFAAYIIYYLDVIHRPGKNRLLLAIETLDGKHIGNCICYDIDESKGEAQVGIMIGDRDYWDKGYGTDALRTLVNHIFRRTMVNRLYLKTLDWNIRAQRCFLNCGFTEYSRGSQNGYHFLFMEMKREHWQKSSDKNKDESLTH
jgi:RimJ/RimL family protein N-acetyltransferase